MVDCRVESIDKENPSLLYNLKVGIHRELKLPHKNLLERLNVRLLVKNQHRFLVFE
jgi:hypothetical protein